MLEDLSAHVLDIAENSVMANGTEVVIEIYENRSEDRLIFSIEDNGKGMSEEFILKVTDPFTTTRTTRRVGMGLPFLKQSLHAFAFFPFSAPSGEFQHLLQPDNVLLGFKQMGFKSGF